MFLIILLCAFTSLVSASTKNSEKKLILKKTNTEIIIDGVIDPAWSRADSVSDFFQLAPYYAKEPSKRTVSKVLTTGDAIYCLMINYDNRSNIQSNAGVLDEFGSSDIVSFMLDTFNDKKTAYKFAVTAAGVRLDCRLLDDGRNRDYNWDGIWFADSKIYDWGFVVEMKIPYKSIQYNEDAQTWGLDFDRWIPSLTEDLYWCEYEQNEGQRISKFGQLVFDDFKPSVKGLNLELYPLAISKISYLPDGKYKNEPNAGLDILYNPSPKLTYQLTVNPDFAQIEADPFQFNISRYETYFSERRPFFTQGNEIFMPSGKSNNSGFYSPMELFYSRRIGKKLPGGKEVPLIFGTKAFGRINDWEYGGFLAMTGETDYNDDGITKREERAYFGSARIKKQILDNSNVGILFVGKNSIGNNSGVLDIDGALRESDWQLAYQVARSFKNSEGDFAASAGFTKQTTSWMTLIRSRYVGNNFDISQVGYVPWKGTATFVGITGPTWYYDSGYLAQLSLYGGPAFSYEKVDAFTDYSGILGINMQFRNNWGYEIDYSFGEQKDSDVKYFCSELTFSSWFNISPKWNANLYGGYTNTYNFSRNYLAFYSWVGSYFAWKPFSILDIGTSYDMFIEGNPSGNVEDITYNARPYLTITPVNDLNARIYLDNVFVKSSDKLERIIFGFLFSYNFSPKSWIYFAVNDIKDRSQEFDFAGNSLPVRMHVVDRVGVLKVKYLYYF
ncbi:MAG: carbohydrate binding family 9 domain-containing protein [Ignavibacteriaceae bacterium]|nr:carbohydrate binding family 9 domain-containing protein [Ignavibacteriaceae bacterium]